MITEPNCHQTEGGKNEFAKQLLLEAHELLHEFEAQIETLVSVNDQRPAKAFEQSQTNCASVSQQPTVPKSVPVEIQSRRRPASGSQPTTPLPVRRRPVSAYQRWTAPESKVVGSPATTSGPSTPLRTPRRPGSARQHGNPGITLGYDIPISESLLGKKCPLNERTKSGGAQRSPGFVAKLREQIEMDHSTAVVSQTGSCDIQEIDSHHETSTGDLTILFETPFGKITMEGLKETMRVADVIQRLVDHFGTAAGSLWLNFGGKPLSPTALLETYNVVPNCSIQCMVRALGGGGRLKEKSGTCSEPLQKLFADMGCQVKTSLRGWAGSGKGMYDCGWRCAGSPHCKQLFNNTNVSRKRCFGHVHTWKTTPTSDGGHWHSFTAVRPPNVKPPSRFPQPPVCPDPPGPPSEAFIKATLSEDLTWSDWERAEEDRLTQLREMAEADRGRKWFARKQTFVEMAEDAMKSKKLLIQHSMDELDCPAKTDFITCFPKSDEGEHVIARSRSGSHTLELASLAEVIIAVGLDRRDFEDFVEREKPNWVGEDVSLIVRAFMDSIPLTHFPGHPQFEADMEYFKNQQEEKWKWEREERFQALILSMKKQREEMADEVTRQWEVSTLESRVWQKYLLQADAWTCRCERLTMAWDEYDRKRSVLKSEIGDPPGFVPRAVLYVAPPADWASHPVLKHTMLHTFKGSSDDLPERWARLHSNPHACSVEVSEEQLGTRITEALQRWEVTNISSRLSEALESHEMWQLPCMKDGAESIFSTSASTISAY